MLMSSLVDVLLAATVLWILCVAQELEVAFQESHLQRANPDLCPSLIRVKLLGWEPLGLKAFP